MKRGLINQSRCKYESIYSSFEPPPPFSLRWICGSLLLGVWAAGAVGEVSWAKTKGLVGKGFHPGKEQSGSSHPSSLVFSLYQRKEL